MDKLWFTISEEVIVKFHLFFQKITKHSTFNSKDGYVLVFVKISYYHKNMPYIYIADLSQISRKSKTGNFVISFLLWV